MHFEKRSGYLPGSWMITEKSDIWGVGLVALELLYAGRGPGANAVLDDRISNLSQNWNEVLQERTEVDEDDGLFDRERFDPPEFYSIGLVRIIERCLRYLPASRPGLYEMKAIIDTNIARLNSLYGDKVRKGHADIAEDHKVHLAAEPTLSQFNICQDYESPRKCRRLSIDTEMLDEYRNIVDEWTDASTFPRPDLPTQAQVLDTIEDSAKGD